ncbi:MAG: MBL fold metallo-hydrolase [Candidatus Dadabacteria bacterium]|nr:MBL fold metallo-hydrolase [Candidatus Dadabacteria bacterium]TDJ02354.1 MAG: MBL fold metallo-hydrolase [Candidatus Dadabacteria bacterium]
MRNQIWIHTKGILTIITTCLLFSTSVVTGAEEEHFDPKGKPPSDSTVERNNQLRKSLPFSDKRDFEEQKKGFIAKPEYDQIKNESGEVVWDIGRYDFLLQGKDFDSINPSLQRQAILNMNYGLYEVVPGIYQVRGFDLSNITFVKGETGWIVIDPLTTKETAKAALELVNEELGARPVLAVIYSHSHADHWGGVKGLVTEAEVRSGKVKIIAPVGFMEHAISENVYAGNAMNRRLFYQYGSLLPKNPFGHVDQAIGKTVSTGVIGLIPPNVIIDKPVEELTVDGVEMIFQNTPGTEAPSEMNTYFPQFKAFWAAENITGTIHNIYTLRGAPVRDSLRWSKYINDALYMYGQEAEVMFASHSWPRWGNDRIQEVMKGQRDMYAHQNNQVLHLANQGVTINEIHNVYEAPKSLQQQWYARGYHGSFEHNSRGVVNRYLGYWDGNPTTLIPLSPGDSAPLYAEMMGGSKKIMTKGKELYDTGDYLLCTEIVNKLVYAEPTNQGAKDLLADCFEQIGYQQESTSLRNSFLAAAYELRNNIPEGATPKTMTSDVARAIPTELMLDYFAIKVDSRKAEDLEFIINWIQPDNGENFVIEMSNATLTNIKGYQADDPDLTITINRSDLEKIVTGQATIDEMVNNGTIKLDGNTEVLGQLKQTMVQFQLGFEIMPGTKKVPDKPHMKPFELPEPVL